VIIAKSCQPYDKQEIKDPVIIFCQVSFNGFHVIIVLISKYKTGFSRKGCTTLQFICNIFTLAKQKLLTLPLLILIQFSESDERSDKA
jgi:hypothetical protein